MVDKEIQKDSTIKYSLENSLENFSGEEQEDEDEDIEYDDDSSSLPDNIEGDQTEEIQDDHKDDVIQEEELSEELTQKPQKDQQKGVGKIVANENEESYSLIKISDLQESEVQF